MKNLGPFVFKLKASGLVLHSADGSWARNSGHPCNRMPSGTIDQRCRSSRKLYRTLSKCRIDHIRVKIVGIETCNLTYQTDDQKELLGRIGLIMTHNSEVLHKARAVLNA